MDNWNEIELEEYVDVNPRISLKKHSIATKVAMECVEPFTKSISTFTIEEYKGGVKFCNGDTLMARITPSLENGKTSKVDILNEDEIGFGSTEFIVLRAKEGKTDPDFVYYLAISPELREVAIQSMTGSSGRQRVQTDVVKQFPFLFPPLHEQKAIAEVLNSLDDKIDLLYRQNKTLEAMTEKLFRHWFVEEADEGWADSTISDIANHTKISIKPQSNEAILYNHYSIPSFDDNKKPVREYGAEIKSNKYQVVKNSVLFSKLNPHKDKRVWLIQDLDLDDIHICSTEFQVVEPYEKENLYFIYGWLSLKDNYREIASGVGGTSGSHQRISPDIIFNFPCPIVPLSYIKKYNNVAEPIFKKQFRNHCQIITLENLRDILLPKLMSGEVRVKMY